MRSSLLLISLAALSACLSCTKQQVQANYDKQETTVSYTHLTLPTTPYV